MVPADLAISGGVEFIQFRADLAPHTAKSPPVRSPAGGCPAQQVAEI
jgi:hypothetical protein